MQPLTAHPAISNHPVTATLNPDPNPVPCHWRTSGPMLLADDRNAATASPRSGNCSSAADALHA